MKDDKNYSQVKSQLDELTHLFKDATVLHESLLHLIPLDEKDKQNTWFSSIIKYNKGFIEDVEIWLSETSQCSSRPSSDKLRSQETPTGEEMEVQEQMEPQLSAHFQHDIQDDVLPSDSVSNQGSKLSSKVSSTSSARLRAEAEMAALLTRQTMLKEKHAIEEQEEQLRKRREQLQLEAEIAATAAKVKVLKTGSAARSSASRKSNGMESYFKTKRNAVESLNADANTFVLQTKRKPINENAELQIKPMQQNVTKKRSPPLLGSSHPVSRTMSNMPLQQAAQSATNENLLSIMEKQNELTCMLVRLQSLSSLPKREIQPFDGGPLHFQAFMRSFDQVVESKTGDPDDCLHYLAQYTRGQPNELVKNGFMELQASNKWLTCLRAE
ncbi:PREDICTED: uncharacterized protein LOC106922808 [Poecilia mexicana]|uniref:uncharacterized protein LOC106922808 n=1 Tax=Poecilia mexicana TaxID=48701 RepID=UPI00072E0BF9|nr:PREDICTED: uncharacterized protein LOC106922808 [Poecilia mexicana]